jgi:hypothetical protein
MMVDGVAQLMGNVVNRLNGNVVAQLMGMLQLS